MRKRSSRRESSHPETSGSSTTETAAPHRSSTSPRGGRFGGAGHGVAGIGRWYSVGPPCGLSGSHSPASASRARTVRQSPRSGIPVPHTTQAASVTASPPAPQPWQRQPRPSGVRPTGGRGSDLRRSRPQEGHGRMRLPRNSSPRAAATAATPRARTSLHHPRALIGHRPFRGPCSSVKDRLPYRAVLVGPHQVGESGSPAFLRTRGRRYRPPALPRAGG